MQTYDYIDKLNAAYSSGLFLRAAILTVSLSPLVKRYFVDFERSITFAGNVYEILPMKWLSVKSSSGMSLSTVEVVVSNIGDQVTEYQEETDITGNPCTLQIVHLDLLSTLTNFWQRLFDVQFVRAKPRVQASIILGRNIGLEDDLPRRVMTKADFPGLLDNVTTIL